MTATQLLCVFIAVSLFFSSPSHASVASSIMNLPYLPINILLFFSSLPNASPVSFHIQQFDATDTSIIYEGDAEPVNGTVELTNKVQYVGRVGRAIYAEQVPLWDSHNRVLTDFNTNFSFLIDKKGHGTYGSGFAFYLAPWGYPIPPNSGGGFLGLFNKTTREENPAKLQVVLVEFDYYVDGEWDPSYQHIGINSNSISSVVCKRWNVNLHDGETVEVYISYNATTTNLSVHWSYKDHEVGRDEPTSLSHIIDLTKFLPERVSVGFSGGTSQYGERHKILSWKFDSTLDGINGGASTVKHTNMTHLIREIIVVAAIVITLTIGVLIAKPVGSLFNWLKNNVYRKKETKLISALLAELPSSSSTREEVGARRVSDQDIVPAPDSFCELDMDTAEKKISSSSGQGRRESITKVNRNCSTTYSKCN